MAKADNLIWIDMEMTGLDPDLHRVIEIATVVTDDQLNVIAEGPVLVVHQPDDHLSLMDDWCVQQHGSSGLTAKVRKSLITEKQAEAETIAFLSQYVEPGQSPMCGNTIGQDRRFLYRYMPDLERFFHYRSIDVSTLKELARRWNPALLSGINKTASHQALADIYESIDELRYYREHFIQPPLSASPAKTKKAKTE
ncbi:oligoribonuclease [Zooshikella sp. RANM57]|uniref:oligoribonuclease n=1 Tax=Zooshikella sp. RANM57 TaxID=3425863 RepID=UPI003D6DE1E3